MISTRPSSRRRSLRAFFTEAPAESRSSFSPFASMVPGEISVGLIARTTRPRDRRIPALRVGRRSSPPFERPRNGSHNSGPEVRPTSWRFADSTNVRAAFRRVAPNKPPIVGVVGREDPVEMRAKMVSSGHVDE